MAFACPNSFATSNATLKFFVDVELRFSNLIFFEAMRHVDLNLQNSTVVIVGGASGIGKACVDAFLNEGAKVAVWDLSQDTPQLDNERLLILSVDIVIEDQVRQAVVQTEQALGTIDHVVHSAAVGSGKFGSPFTNVEPADWHRVLDVNIQGMVNVAHHVSPGMMQRRKGTFVFIASVAGQVGSPTDPPYTASKAANISFAQVMARDLAAFAIRVNTVCPGMVKTPLNQSVWAAWNQRQPAEERKSYEQWAKEKIRLLIPLNEWQQPEDIADTVLFLSSQRARQITGQTINVDGGYVMHW